MGALGRAALSNDPPKTMSILQLNVEFAGADWKRAFAEELIRRLPGINPDAADEVADALYLRYPHRSPACTAAEVAQTEQAPARLQAARNDYDSNVR